MLVNYLVTDRVPETLDSSFGIVMGSLRQVEQSFSSFSDKILPYLMTFQSAAAPSVHSILKIHQI